MSKTVNVAAYKFAEIGNLVSVRDGLREACKTHDLRGTILVSGEGINLSIAGGREGVDAVLDRVRAVPGVGQLAVKESYSEHRPFNRMLVKIKKEIIAFGVPGIAPAEYTSRRVSAGQLKRWLDEGRAVTLLDTRNRFEVQTGSFDGAVSIGVDDFRNFPDAVDSLPAEMKRRPVVTFCTGGIRCEKAAPYLERAGFTDVYQLDGGILDYFKQCGGAHFHGDCFVFDQRVALNAELNASGLMQCYVCHAILSVEAQNSADYVKGESCPRCRGRVR